MEKKEAAPLDEAQTTAFRNAIKGHRFAMLYTADLFTGMRRGELLELTRECAGLAREIMGITKQLQ